LKKIKSEESTDVHITKSLLGIATLRMMVTIANPLKRDEQTTRKNTYMPSSARQVANISGAKVWLR
jgi:hypothetical protein